MKFIEIDLDGSVVRAALDDGAPKTSEAIFNALPFEGTAVHAQGSGEMFRMLEHAPVTLEGTENPVVHQWPGAIVFLPSVAEIAICAGEARFGGHSGPLALTLLGQIEGNPDGFLTKGDSLDRLGGRPIRFRKAADQATPFRHRTHRGRRIEIGFGSVKVGATLLEEMAPKTTAALAKVLPFAGEATNSTRGLQVTRVWGAGADGAIDLNEPLENGKFLHWPGYVYFEPQKKALWIAYGECEIKNVDGPAYATPVAAIDGADLATYVAEAKKQLIDGVKRLSIALK